MGTDGGVVRGGGNGSEREGQGSIAIAVQLSALSSTFEDEAPPVREVRGRAGEGEGEGGMGETDGDCGCHATTARLSTCGDEEVSPVREGRDGLSCPPPASLSLARMAASKLMPSSRCSPSLPPQPLARPRC